MTYLMTALVAGAVLEVAVTWWLLRGLRRLDQVDARIGHLTEALRLLAETTEAGFRASATELARVADGARTESTKKDPQPPVEKSAKAARRTVLLKKAGADVREGRTRRKGDAVAADAAPAPARKRRRAAASEHHAEGGALAVTAEMSESEARLRLLLAERDAADAAAREVARGALRA